MEEETLSIVAIIIAAIAIIGCCGVYMQIPAAENNPVTWGAITQYNDEITAIQLRMTEIERNRPVNYDSILINLRDDIDDLDDKYKDDVDDLDDDVDNLRDRLEIFEALPTPTNGIDGVDGADGINGLPGTDGSDGENGADGARGPRGRTGADGADCSLLDIDCDTECTWDGCSTTCNFVTN